uniref:Substance-P receptor-like n=1 Tax=Actinia tenebrosa TaxID=6105 RepID=A0A6P8J456_ACTTE
MDFPNTSDPAVATLGKNTTNTLACPESKDSIFSKGLKIFWYFAIIGLSLLGNALVVWVVRRTARMRTVTNYFIVDVSLADLLTTLFNMLPTLFWIIQGVDIWYIGGTFGEALCKLFQFFQLVSISCSVLSMAAIAFDRFFAIFRPLKRTISFPRAKQIIVAIWLASIVFSCPNLYALRLEQIGGVVYCVEKWSPLFDEAKSPLAYTIALFIGLYALPLFIIAVIYTTVILRLWSRTTPGQNSITNRSNRERTNKKVLKMLITVVVVFAVCWLPLYVRMFLLFSFPVKYLCGLPYHMDFITLYLGHANSAVNPYIYVIFNENFRKGFKAVIMKQHPESERMSSTKIQTTPLQQERTTLLLKRLKKNGKSTTKTENDGHSAFVRDKDPELVIEEPSSSRH